ncbi:MAG: SUMF1/EgtB/PvdO family nonheme iron enzyme [Candidatus Delongbacteria bacterium]|nr:SUMF1/EgtB/PvdO family nonheme iron enzyme [Candidatus Delongbacteria bacterium]
MKRIIMLILIVGLTMFLYPTPADPSNNNEVKKSGKGHYDKSDDIYIGKESDAPKDTTLYKSESDAAVAQKYKKKRKPNEKIYYGKDNKKMVLIPAQSFEMGSDEGSSIEKPAHKAKVRAFYMDATEVTNIQFKRFLKDSGYKPKGSLEHLRDKRFNQDAQPIVDVSYYDAVAYAKWAKKRLPTEREWECAARDGNGSKYPVGETISTSKARYGMRINTGSTTKTGSYRPNKYGIFDLAGNAAEWVSGVLSAYPGNKGLIGYGKNRISRGGCWSSKEKEMTVYSRKSLNISNSTGSIGFRCAIDHDLVMRRANKK